MHAFCTILFLAQKYATLSLFGSFLGMTGHPLGGVLWVTSDDGGSGGSRPENRTASGECGGVGSGDDGPWPIFERDAVEETVTKEAKKNNNNN